MKLFVVVVALLSVAVVNVRAELNKEEAVAIVTACKEEAGASDADFEAMVKHKPAETKEGKCMRACALKKFGVMSDEGKLIKDAATELAKEFIKDEAKKELAGEIIGACDGLAVSDDHCEAAEEYGECVEAEFKSKGIESEEDLLS